MIKRSRRLFPMIFIISLSKKTDEVPTIMEHIRSALRLYIRRLEEVRGGYRIYARKKKKADQLCERFLS